ncbi:hypothetical protein NIES2101_09360 [Calothrix sp. HK-06]|nr:hypothetical protein NIES2101_09360 [Calothrix sp. HK-06]
MDSNKEDIFDTTGLREGVRQSVELMQLQNLQQIINVVLLELVDCGHLLADCLLSVAFYLHKQAFQNAAKLVESTALEL